MKALIGRKYLEGKKEGKRLGGKMRLVTIWWEADYNSSVSVFEARCKKEEGRMGTRNSDIRATSAAFNSYFLNNFFGKGIRWMSMKGLFYFLKIIIIKILLVFDVRSF